MSGHCCNDVCDEEVTDVEVSLNPLMSGHCCNLEEGVIDEEDYLAGLNPLMSGHCCNFNMEFG